MGPVQDLLAGTNRWHSVLSREALAVRKRRLHRSDPEMTMMALMGRRTKIRGSHVYLYRHFKG